jgi:hypothetical protein
LRARLVSALVSTRLPNVDRAPQLLAFENGDAAAQADVDPITITSGAARLATGSQHRLRPTVADMDADAEIRCAVSSAALGGECRALDEPTRNPRTRGTWRAVVNPFRRLGMVIGVTDWATRCG